MGNDTKMRLKTSNNTSTERTGHVRSRRPDALGRAVASNARPNLGNPFDGSPFEEQILATAVPQSDKRSNQQTNRQLFFRQAGTRTSRYTAHYICKESAARRFAAGHDGNADNKNRRTTLLLWAESASHYRASTDNNQMLHETARWPSSVVSRLLASDTGPDCLSLVFHRKGAALIFGKTVATVKF